MKVKHNQLWFYALIATILCPLLVACGGGISGSGNGGGSPSPNIVTPTIGYSIDNVPVRLAAAIPPSLVTNIGENLGQAEGPQAALSSRIGSLIERKVDLGLIQLYVDAAWDEILDHCESTEVNRSCKFEGAGIGFEYTSDMAIWEYNLRARIARERAGAVGLLTEGQYSIIQDIVAQKIGRTIALDNGSFKRVEGEEYDYEVSLEIAEQSQNPVHYTLSWNTISNHVLASIVDINQGASSYMQSIYRPTSEDSIESQAVLLTTLAAESQHDFQLNLHEIPGEAEVYVESQLTQVGIDGKVDIYTRGQADKAGGFLYSETTNEDTHSTESVALQREYFNIEENVYSFAECEPSLSQDACKNQNDWSLVQGIDPIESTYFLPLSKLTEFNAELKPFNLSLASVSETAESFLLLKRENLTLSFTADGIEISLPGLGAVSWPPQPGQIDTVVNEADHSAIASATDSVLCRIARSDVIGEPEFRTFCAGTVADISEALVISESYVEGKFVIEWQANAEIILDD